MKKFTRIEPTTVQVVGERFKKQTVVKRFRTGDGLEHEFTTWNEEGAKAVAVLAITDENEVVIAHQFRAGREKYCYDLPGGGVNAGESLDEAARRELLEETGYEPGVMTSLGSFSWDAYQNLVSHYFLATECKRVSDPLRDVTENDQGIETKHISVAELIDYARQNLVADVAAVFLAYDELKILKEGGES